MKIHSNLFSKKLNVNSKLISLNKVVKKEGPRKYLPPVSKEWRNNVYNFNNRNDGNYSIYDLEVNKLIGSYFNFYFKDWENEFISYRMKPKFRKLKRKSRKLKRKVRKLKLQFRKLKRRSLNKIFVSRGEIKHTNSKVLITIYVYNREKKVLLKKIQKFKILFLKLIIYILFKKEKSHQFIVSLKKKKSNLLRILTNFIQVNLNFIRTRRRLYSRLIRFVKRVTQIIKFIKKYKLRYSLNQSKFEERFLYVLIPLIKKYYNKEVEFNIISLRRIEYNTDIFTEILTTKIKNKKGNPFKMINLLLKKVVLPNQYKIFKKFERNVNQKLLENRFQDKNISNIIILNDLIPGYTLNNLVYNIYLKNIWKDTSQLAYWKIRSILLENIKSKYTGGARLRVKGRLTPRYRADRSQYHLKWKGGSKIQDSSYKIRGYLGYNVEKSFLASKRRVGSFGVKSILSGNN